MLYLGACTGASPPVCVPCGGPPPLCCTKALGGTLGEFPAPIFSPWTDFSYPASDLLTAPSSGYPIAIAWAAYAVTVTFPAGVVPVRVCGVRPGIDYQGAPIVVAQDFSALTMAIVGQSVSLTWSALTTQGRHDPAYVLGDKVEAGFWVAVLCESGSDQYLIWILVVARNTLSLLPAGPTVYASVTPYYCATSPCPSYEDAYAAGYAAGYACAPAAPDCAPWCSSCPGAYADGHAAGSADRLTDAYAAGYAAGFACEGMVSWCPAECPASCAEAYQTGWNDGYAAGGC